MIRKPKNVGLAVRTGRLLGCRAAGWMAMGPLLGLLLLAGPARAGSIFDDDWVPPTRTKPAEPVESKPAKPPEAGRPVEPTAPMEPAPVVKPPKLPKKPKPIMPAPPVPEPVVPVAPEPRRAIPPDADQAKSRKLFKEVFTTELADHSIAGRHALAAKLLSQATGLHDVTSDQFVLLLGATDAAREADDLDLCCHAADALGAGYDVDALHMKSDMAAKMTFRANTPAGTADNCRAGVKLVDDLVAAEDYVTAVRLLQSIRAVEPDHAMIADIQTRLKDISELRAAADRVAPSIERLKTVPDDPAANLAVGEYYCLSKGDWDRGLLLLVKGDKGPLNAAATLDLSGATEPHQQILLGNAWWDLGEKETGLTQRALRSRAKSWYTLASESGTVSGLERTLIDKRMAIILATPGANEPPMTELLPAMNGFAEHKEADGTVTLTHGAITTLDRYSTPVSFRIVAQTDSTNLRIRYGSTFIFNWEGRRDQLRVDGGPASGRHKDGAGAVPTNRWVDITLTTTSDTLTLVVDGREIYRTQADFSKVNDTLSIFPSAGSTVKVKSVLIKQSDQAASRARSAKKGN